MPLLSLAHVTRRYSTGGTTIVAVDDVSLEVDPGECLALVGPSGCGKSTLLHLCGAMDRPSAGSVRLGGRDLAGLADDALTRVRRREVGFVFQFFNLLPTLTALENVELPLRLMRRGERESRDAARALLERVGLGSRTGHFPRELSGGELQRVALARALVHAPALLVADEPTGNLDSDHGRRVLDLLLSLQAETGVTLLVATHAPEIAAAAARVVRMRDGRLEQDDRRHVAV